MSPIGVGKRFVVSGVYQTPQMAAIPSVATGIINTTLALLLLTFVNSAVTTYRVVLRGMDGVGAGRTLGVDCRTVVGLVADQQVPDGDRGGTSWTVAETVGVCTL